MAHGRVNSEGGGPADVVIRGGTVRTLDPHDTVVDALAIREGVVVALGGANTGRLVGGATRIIELDGRTAVPGINDAHLHAAWLGARWPNLFFGDHAVSHDEAGPIVTDEDGRRRALRRAWRLIASFGITSYTEPGIGPGEDDGETGCFGSPMLRTYLDLHAERAQTSRVTLLRLFGALDGESHLDDFERGLATPPPRTDQRWLAVSGVKIFADGIPPLRTAWVSEPYVDGSTGEVLTRGGSSPADAFRRMIIAAHHAGTQIGVHATGDRSIAEFLDTLDSVNAEPRTHPHYVVHGDLVTTELLERMRRRGVGLAIQPLIAAHTASWASSQLGERAAKAWPIAEMLAKDIVTTITSDAPIAHPDWRRSLDAALMLVGTANTASRARLLRTVTSEPARQDGAATWKGTIEPGKVADIVVLDEDPIEVGRPFGDLAIELTLTDGRVVFDRAKMSNKEDALLHEPAVL